MNVLVNGIGNIGTTLLALLAHHRKHLSLDTIYALKNNAMPWHDEDLAHLEQLGIVICTRNSNDNFESVDAILDRVNYIFDCTNNGGGLKNREWYLRLPNLVGASAQGSEKLFGIPFMSGVNDNALIGEKFAHIVSCNTHSLASLLTTFAGQNLGNHKSSDFVVVRRSEDIGNHQRLVAANVVARHLDDQLGTHHSIDLRDLFETRGLTVEVTSSDVTTPSQLMHAVRFNISLNRPKPPEQIVELMAANPYISTTTKFDSNVIFERGRRIGFQGRIYSHALVVANNMLISNKSIKGWAFIPQEGNTLLSTLHAFLLQTAHPKQEQVMEHLRGALLVKTW